MFALKMDSTDCDGSLSSTVAGVSKNAAKGTKLRLSAKLSKELFSFLSAFCSHKASFFARSLVLSLRLEKEKKCLLRRLLRRTSDR